MAVIFPDTVRISILTVDYKADLPKWRYRNLASPYWRFYWNAAGGAWMTLEEKEYMMDPEHCYLIPPETPFNANHSGPFPHFYIHFTVGEPFDRVMKTIFEFPVSGDLLRMIRRLIDLADRNVQGYRVSTGAASLIYRMLDQLPDDIFLTSAASRISPEVFRYIDLNLDRKITVGMLAKVAGMQEDGFIRSFRRKMHITPAKFVLRRKLEKASVLLVNSTLGIKQIAASCGFPDRNYFTTSFRRIYGTTPARMAARRAPG